MQVTLSVDSVRMTHGPRPDSRRRDQVTQTLRVFELQTAGEDVPTWHIDIERPDAAVRVNDAFLIFDRTRGQVGPVYGADALREQILSRAAFPATLLRYVQSAGQVLGATSAPSGGSDVLVELEGGRADIGAVEFLTSWPAGGEPLGGPLGEPLGENVWLDRAPVQQIADAK